MKRLFVIALLTLAAAAAVLGITQGSGAGKGGEALKASLVKMEKEAWEAWKNKDRAYFDKFLATPSINVHGGGVDDRARILTAITDTTCDVKSYGFDESSFRVTMLDNNTAILTFKGTQEATCGGQTLPAAVWASTVFVKRGNKWLAAFHQETPATQ